MRPKYHDYLASLDPDTPLLELERRLGEGTEGAIFRCCVGYVICELLWQSVATSKHCYYCIAVVHSKILWPSIRQWDMHA